MDRLLLVLLGIGILIFSVTYLLWRVSPRVKLVKYTPAVLCLLTGVYYLYLAKTVQDGFTDLANAILAMMLFSGFASGLATCLFFDYVWPRYKS